MDWRAANEQREDALFCVFIMLVVMVLLTIRSVMDSRSASAVLPLESAPQCDAPMVRIQPLSAPPAHLHCAALRLLGAAEAAARRLIGAMRAAYELMKHAHALARPARACKVSNQCGQSRERLDSS